MIDTEGSTLPPAVHVRAENGGMSTERLPSLIPIPRLVPLAKRVDQQLQLDEIANSLADVRAVMRRVLQAGSDPAEPRTRAALQAVAAVNQAIAAVGRYGAAR